MNRYNTYDRYADIINLPHPELPRPRMSLEERAVQFMPFQALTGHGNMTKEAAKWVTEEYNKY